MDGSCHVQQPGWVLGWPSPRYLNQVFPCGSVAAAGHPCWDVLGASSTELWPDHTAGMLLPLLRGETPKLLGP